MLGYRGHFLTKSRRYSVTFGQLRQARVTHAKPSGIQTARRIRGAATSMNTPRWLMTSWHYTGTGHATTAERQLALAAAARAHEHDQIAQEETWTN
jgi:hypothetical protein